MLTFYVIVSISVMVAFMATVIYKSREDIRTKKWTQSDTLFVIACALLVGLFWVPVVMTFMLAIPFALIAFVLMAIASKVP